MHAPSRLVITLAPLLALACGGSSSGGGTGPTPGNDPAGAWLTFDPSPLRLILMPGQAKPFLLTARSSRTFTETINVAIVDRDGVTSGETSITAYSATQYTASMSTSTALSIGSHTGTLEVRLCFDNPAVCARSLPGSPWRIPYDIRVIDPGEYTLAGWEQAGTHSAPFLDDYALSSSGTSLVAVSYGPYSHLMETWTSGDDGLTWTKLAGSGPDLLTRGFALATDGTNVYLSGGRSIEDTATPRFTNHVWKFDGSAWQQRVAAAAFPAREGHAMAVVNGTLYVLGGFRGTTNLSDVWQSTDDGATWTQVGSGLPAGAGGQTCAIPWKGGLLVAHDGVWTSADGASWAAHPSYAFPYRLYASHCAALGDRLFIHGQGGPYGYALVSSVDLETWRYEPGGYLNAAPGMAAVNERLFLVLGANTSYRPVMRTKR